MPWVNTTAADRSGRVPYADHSVVPNVPDELAATCMTAVGRVLGEAAGLPGLDGSRAGSDCAWRNDADAARPGVFGPGNLPKTVRRDWVMNANDSHWLPNPKEPLEGYAGIIGCVQCQRTLRSRMVYRYVRDRLASGPKVTPRSLRRTQHTNRIQGAELMREDGALDTVCQLAQGGQACEVLAAWDGRSDTDSVGTHLFEAFVERLHSDLLGLPTSGLWLTPFSASDPVGTPRTLNAANPQVVQAMRDAIAHLEAEGVPLDAPWGSVQVAGDRGARPLLPVTYGSSHIQSVAFRDRGLSAHTILTYGQSENPRSPWSLDQTRKFSRERWVRFPWTDRQIRKQRISRIRVTAP